MHNCTYIVSSPIHTFTVDCIMFSVA